MRKARKLLARVQRRSSRWSRKFMGSAASARSEEPASSSGPFSPEDFDGSGGYIAGELFHVDSGGKAPTFANFFHKPTGYPC